MTKAMNSRFAKLVNKEMKKRDLSVRQLADEAGISAGYLSLILSEKRNPPRPDVIKRIADTLELWPPMLIILAGYFPPNDKRYYKLIDAVKDLSDRQFDELLDYIDDHFSE